jgi:hypothetical protein
MENIDVTKRMEYHNFKRDLHKRKEDLNKSFYYVNKLFGVDGDEYIKKYDKLSEEMEEVYVKWMKCKLKLNELDYKCERLKMDFIGKYMNGFINSEMNDVLREYFWNNRSGRMEYKFGDKV